MKPNTFLKQFKKNRHTYANLSIIFLRRFYPYLSFFCVFTMTTGIPSLETIKSLNWTFAPLLILELATDGTCATYSSKATLNSKTL